MPGIKLHVEVDTGMGRQGILPGLALEQLLRKVEAAGLIADGVFMHFCSSEVAGSPITKRQEERFEAVIDQLCDLGQRPTWIHAGNSSAIDNPFPDPGWIGRLAAKVGAKPMVRPGLALYGYTLEIEGGGTPAIHDTLEPVMTWKAHVLSTRELNPGESVGYNSIFTADRPMRVALLPVGYADGLRRELSSNNTKAGGWMMIQGQRAPILGRISMNLTVVDVSGISSVQAGDEVVILGGGISAGDHARIAGTIAYEILCGIHPCG
jgi:alanine racemase